MKWICIINLFEMWFCNAMTQNSFSTVLLVFPDFYLFSILQSITYLQWSWWLLCKHYLHFFFSWIDKWFFCDSFLDPIDHFHYKFLFFSFQISNFTTQLQIPFVFTTLWNWLWLFFSIVYNMNYHSINTELFQMVFRIE